MSALLEAVIKFRNSIEPVTNKVSYAYQDDIKELDLAISADNSQQLIDASTALYMAGRWNCDAQVNEELLWENLRDALGLKRGTETARASATQSTKFKNTPIGELLSQYTEENCNFDDIDWVVSAAVRYVNTMPDSQVRCLLHLLAVYASGQPFIDHSYVDEIIRRQNSDSDALTHLKQYTQVELTDDELLRMAAKAVGIKLRGETDTGYAIEIDTKPYVATWNPLIDSGDALNIAIAIGKDMLNYSSEDWEYCKHDARAATRRAIVKAAAEIGRRIK